MSAEELPSIPITERSPLAQAIVELDAARGNLSVSCDRYADFPSEPRANATLLNAGGITQAYGSVVGAILAEDIDTTSAVDMSFNVLLDEDKQRCNMLQSIYPAATFNPTKVSLPELRSLLVDTIKDSETIYDDAGEEDDDIYSRTKQILMNMYGGFLVCDMSNFYKYAETTSRYHWVQTGRRIDKYARRGAMFGATLAVGAYLGRTLKP